MKLLSVWGSYFSRIIRGRIVVCFCACAKKWPKTAQLAKVQLPYETGHGELNVGVSD